MVIGGNSSIGVGVGEWFIQWTGWGLQVPGDGWMR